MGGKFKRYAGSGMQEFFAPTTGKGNLNRRDRRRCDHYQHETGLCALTWIHCVGPTICKTYSEPKQQIRSKESVLGKTVMNKTFGKGVISSVSGDICTITYKTTKMQCYIKDVKKMIDSE